MILTFCSIIIIQVNGQPLENYYSQETKSVYISFSNYESEYLLTYNVYSDSLDQNVKVNIYNNQQYLSYHQKTKEAEFLYFDQRGNYWTPLKASEITNTTGLFFITRDTVHTFYDSGLDEYGDQISGIGTKSNNFYNKQCQITINLLGLMKSELSRNNYPMRLQLK